MWFLTALLDVLKSIEQAVLNASPLSAQALLDLIKTVDGSGSGLDADLVDGRSDIIFENEAGAPSHRFQRTDAPDGGPSFEMVTGDGGQHTVINFASGDKRLLSLRVGTPFSSGERAGVALSITLDTYLEEKTISGGNYDVVAGSYAIAEALGIVHNAGTFAITASQGWVSFADGRLEMAIISGQLTARAGTSGVWALTVQFVGAGH